MTKFVQPNILFDSSVSFKKQTTFDSSVYFKNVTDSSSGAPYALVFNENMMVQKVELGDMAFADASNYININDSETVSRTVYFSSSGSDTTGDGTVGTPYATLLKCIKSIKTVIQTGVTITIQAVAGTYTFTWAPIEKELTRFIIMNAGSGIKSIVINGSMTLLTSGFTLTPSSPDAFNYTCASTFTSNAYQDKFLLVGASYYPIESNGTNNIKTFVGLSTGTSIYEPDVIFNITDRRLNMAVGSFEGFQGGLQISRVTMNITNGGSPTGVSISSPNIGLDIVECTINVQTLQTSGQTIGTLLRSNVVASTASGVAFTQNSDAFQIDYGIIRKSGTLGGTGISYSNNYQRIEGAIYVSNVTTGLAFPSGIYTFSLSGRSTIVKATTAFTIRNNTQIAFTLNGVYLDGTVTNLIGAGETLYGNYQMLILSLYGTPTNWSTSGVYPNGYSNPGKNISISLPGLYTENQSSLIDTLYDNSSGKITIGNITQNKNISILYDVSRGILQEEGTILLNNRINTDLSRILEFDDAGVTFTKDISGNFINLGWATSNTGTNAVFRYSIQRIMNL